MAVLFGKAGGSSGPYPEMLSSCSQLCVLGSLLGMFRVPCSARMEMVSVACKASTSNSCAISLALGDSFLHCTLGEAEVQGRKSRVGPTWQGDAKRQLNVMENPQAQAKQLPGDSQLGALLWGQGRAAL